MCRFNSGFFFRHELLQQYDYYWRLEPDVKLFCDIDYDPFLFMQDNKKVYGFTLSLYEFTETIPTLWDVTKEFMKLHPQYIHKDNALGFLSDDNGETWNHCHCMSSNLTQILYTCPLLVVWSNFEIGDLNFWRSEPYMKFFEFLESKGGFLFFNTSDGVMLRCIASAPLCLCTETRFISLMISGIGTNPSSIAHKECSIPKGNVGVQ